MRVPVSLHTFRLNVLLVFVLKKLHGPSVLADSHVHNSVICTISGLQGVDYEGYCLLGCYAVYTVSQTLRKNVVSQITQSCIPEDNILQRVVFNLVSAVSRIHYGK
jgi:hypothetical protein